MRDRYAWIPMAVLIVAAALLPCLAATSTPQLIKLQGYLTDKSGPEPAPAEGSYAMFFDLYDAEVDGLLVASVGPLLVEATNGLYEVELGFGSSAFDGTGRWVEIGVEGQILTPRLHLTSTPFAHMADLLDGRDADELDDTQAIADAVTTLSTQITTEVGAAVDDRVAISGDAMTGPLSIDLGGTSGPALTLTGDQGNVSIGGAYNTAAQARVKIAVGDDFDGALRVVNTSATGPIAYFGTDNSASHPDWSNAVLMARSDGRVDVTGRLKVTAGGATALTTAGNVGLGTDAPQAKLDIRTPINPGGDGVAVTEWAQYIGSVVSGNSPIGDAFGLRLGFDANQQLGKWAGIAAVAEGQYANEVGMSLHSDGQEHVRIDWLGRVGIGTPTPTRTLEVNGNALFGDTVDSNFERKIELMSYYGQGANAFIARNGHLLIKPRVHDHLVLLDTGFNGNVGVGRIPDAAIKLDVDGEVRGHVIHITGGADIAEPFDLADEAGAEPGMVVSIDPELPGALRVATRSYDPAVAGIISGAKGIRPGMTLQQAGTLASGSRPIALTGRVWCFADADAGGPIEPGDLLTTSSTPGHAMRVADRALAQGATLGKAMTPLTAGRGMVLVLVALQ